MMSYINNNLMAGEDIILSAKLHPIIYLKSIIAFIFSLWCFTVGTPEASTFGGLVILVAIVLAAHAFITKISTEFTVTNKRVVAKSGFISRQTIEINLSKIEGLGVNQNILGRILNYGTVYVSGTGGAHAPFYYIADPLSLRKTVNEQVEARNG